MHGEPFLRRERLEEHRCRRVHCIAECKLGRGSAGFATWPTLEQ